MDNYQDYYLHALENLCMPPKEAHEWAVIQLQNEQCSA